MTLEEIIIDKIRTDGAITFREFMEMCLYYPEMGFYMSPDCRIGKDGAFYTSAYLTPAFGAVIGRQLEEMWKALGNEEFTVIEYGAGTGMLCHDILCYLKNNHREMYDRLSYGIIEKSPVMRDTEKKLLTEKVSWYQSVDELPQFQGCVFSNELVDNFAVHQVVMEKELMEVYVSYDRGFKEELRPAGPEVMEYMDELQINLPMGFRTEVNLEAKRWIKEVVHALKQGYVMTIDYGHLSDELYKQSRSRGTLLCYRNHDINESFYDDIGQQDITSHVNFSALRYWGENNGLKAHWFTDQCQFLLAMGFNDFLNQSLSQEKDVLLAAKKASAIRHTLLFDMGTKFKVLVQKKE
ncbi:class I SAM-dependent methyltransferase [Parapedobacter sp. DT-150]|uniref:class I SAM-dependent methyltransferase n=1 Tax=Parapedobacter sp. DT-150 TaxID=3396162 RepID=UPI003F1BCCCF